jgi:cytochrome c5
MSRSSRFSCVLIAALALAACGDDGDGDTGATTGGNDAGISAAGCTDTYANFGQKFLMDKTCTTCHGAQAATLGDNVRLDTLDGVKTHKPHIIEHAVDLKEPIMPSGTMGMPAADRERLKKWLDCGPN